MTESDWLTCRDPLDLLPGWPHGKFSERKLRLFACACCRRIWRLLTDERSRTAVEVAERFADGQASGEQLDQACLEAEEVYQNASLEVNDPDNPDPALALLDEYASGAAWTAALSYRSGRPGDDRRYDDHGDAEDASGRASCAVGSTSESWAPECSTQADLARCLFGSPFRPRSVIDPTVLAWNDGFIKKLAESIYSERRFGDLPILADALLDAGCRDTGLMEHLRSAGAHALGCHALDALLGKE